MIWQWMIVILILAGAVGYLAWRFRRRPSGEAEDASCCPSCPYGPAPGKGRGETSEQCPLKTGDGAREQPPG